MEVARDVAYTFLLLVVACGSMLAGTAVVRRWQDRRHGL